MKNPRFCDSCNSSSWSSCQNCAVCGYNCCDECGIWVSASQSLICESCASEQGQAIWQTMAPVMHTIYELQGEMDQLPEELFRQICECKTVDQVREAFARHYAHERKGIQPQGGLRRHAGQWQMLFLTVSGQRVYLPESTAATIQRIAKSDEPIVICKRRGRYDVWLAGESEKQRARDEASEVREFLRDHGAAAGQSGNAKLSLGDGVAGFPVQRGDLPRTSDPEPDVKPAAQVLPYAGRSVDIDPEPRGGKPYSPDSNLRVVNLHAASASPSDTRQEEREPLKPTGTDSLPVPALQPRLIEHAGGGGHGDPQLTLARGGGGAGAAIAENSNLQEQKHQPVQIRPASTPPSRPKPPGSVGYGHALEHICKTVKSVLCETGLVLGDGPTQDLISTVFIAAQKEKSMMNGGAKP